MAHDRCPGADPLHPITDEPPARPVGVGATTSVASMAATWGGPIGRAIGTDNGAMGGGFAEWSAGGDNDGVVDTLNHLIETCLDGEFGFRGCAEQAWSMELQIVFLERATDCSKAAAELRAQVLQLGGEPTKSGTTAGALHRGWIAVRSTLTGYDDPTMLNECESGEDHALGAYGKALRKALPLDVRTVVQRQMDGAQRNHDRIKPMRDQYRERA